MKSEQNTALIVENKLRSNVTQQKNRVVILPCISIRLIRGD